MRGVMVQNQANARLGGVKPLGIADPTARGSDVMKAAMPPRVPLNWRWSSLAGPSG
jgi:hypothetical protein